MSNLRSRLTYANVVATLALFVALGTGGAYAASELAKNSVGRKQIKKAAVTSRALKNRTVAPKDLSRRARGERASVNSNGRLDAGTASRVSFTPPNGYTVTFKRQVANCTYSATPTPFRTEGSDNGNAVIFGKGGRQVTVATYDDGGAAVPAGFDLIVVC